MSRNLLRIAVLLVALLPGIIISSATGVCLVLVTYGIYALWKYTRAGIARDIEIAHRNRMRAWARYHAQQAIQLDAWRAARAS